MKVEGFTLLEMLMVLALTGLALAIAWGAYSSFYLFGREYEKRHDDHAEWLLTDRALTLDAQKADEMILANDSLVFKSPMESIYQKFEAGILRDSNGSRDSFFVPLRRWEVTSEKGLQRLALTFKSGNQAFYHVQPRATARSNIIE